jgi:hypothetical protein
MNDRIGVSEIVVEHCRAAARGTFWWLRTSDALARQGTFNSDFRRFSRKCRHRRRVVNCARRLIFLPITDGNNWYFRCSGLSRCPDSELLAIRLLLANDPVGNVHRSDQLASAWRRKGRGAVSGRMACLSSSAYGDTRVDLPVCIECDRIHLQHSALVRAAKEPMTPNNVSCHVFFFGTSLNSAVQRCRVTNVVAALIPQQIEY